MRKIITLGLILFVAISLTGCGKDNLEVNISGGDFSMNSFMVKQSVKGWNVYTNPAYRYELRFPKDWDYADSGEDGKEARFFPKDKVTNSLVIISYSNWKEDLSLEDFYKNQSEDIFAMEYDKQEIEIGGQPAYWFKQVKNRIEGSEEATIDLLVMKVGERIIEFEVLKDWDEVKTILNSLKFYGGAGIVIE